MMKTIINKIDSIQSDVEIYLADVNPDGPMPTEYNHYLCLDIKIDDKEYRVGCMVGAMEWTHGTVKASGAGIRPFCNAWWLDRSDYHSLDADMVQPILELLSKNSYKLFCMADLKQ